MIPQAGMWNPSLAPLLQITGRSDEMKYETETKIPENLGSTTYYSFLPPRPALSYQQQFVPMKAGGSEATMLPTQIILPSYDHNQDQDDHDPSQSSDEWYSSSEIE
ncbi:uncharacterized protein LOC131025003 [Salvia miltiorrhiza]|nr:uncharacterized protein LOC131025003 [Salvia miltiorrhiza]